MQNFGDESFWGAGDIDVCLSGSQRAMAGVGTVQLCSQCLPARQVYLCCAQAYSQGSANVPTTNLDAPGGDLQNINDKHADQPAGIRATAYCIHVLPLLNNCGWK